MFAGDGLRQVSAAGGAIKSLTDPVPEQGEVSHRLPQMLPGSRAVTFTVTHAGFPIWEETQIVVQSLVTGERKDLVKGADARFVPSGHLVYMRAGALFAVPFDLERLQVTGGPVSVIQDVMQAAYVPGATNDSGAGQFAVSASGAFVDVPGGMFPELERSLLWVDRTGATEAVTREGTSLLRATALTRRPEGAGVDVRARSKPLALRHPARHPDAADHCGAERVRPVDAGWKTSGIQFGQGYLLEIR